jgi:hypothetical protein
MCHARGRGQRLESWWQHLRNVASPRSRNNSTRTSVSADSLWWAVGEGGQYNLDGGTRRVRFPTESFSGLSLICGSG